jgi:Double-stranded DNA deaminase toxin A
VSVTSATVPTVQPPQPLPIQRRDGSYYPAAAAWAVDLLPRRVREGEERERTVGQVMLAGTSVGQMTSGRDGTWTSDVQRRLRELGSRVRIRLENHVEMKVAHMMIYAGSQTGEVVINHVPCGSLPQQAIGCHQVLERYLPSGYTLTVHGTTQQGQPFSWTYRGQA